MMVRLNGRGANASLACPSPIKRRSAAASPPLYFPLSFSLAHLFPTLFPSRTFLKFTGYMCIEKQTDKQTDRQTDRQRSWVCSERNRDLTPSSRPSLMSRSPAISSARSRHTCTGRSPTGPQSLARPVPWSCFPVTEQPVSGGQRGDVRLVLLSSQLSRHAFAQRQVSQFSGGHVDISAIIRAPSLGYTTNASMCRGGNTSV
jgi:hypothetical protein